MKIQLVLFSLNFEKEPAINVVELDGSEEGVEDEDTGPRIGFTGKVT